MAKKTKKKSAGKPEREKSTPRISDRLCSPGNFARGEWKIISLLFLGALIIRSIYFYINKTNNPVFDFPILDALYHHDWALEIIGGNFWGNEVFFRAPLYPYFLAGVYKLSGASISTAIFVQHVIGAVSVVLVYILSRQYFAPVVAITSGIIAALYWTFIYFEGDLLIVTLAICLDLLFLLAMGTALRSGRTSRFLLSGITLGISAVARPSILIVIPLVPLIARLAGRDGGPQKNPWLKQTVWFLVGSLIIISPVIVRNYVIGRDLVPIASQGGVNFYIGNNAQSNGSLAMVPGAPWDLHGTFQGAIDLAEAEAGRKLKPSEVSNHYFAKGLAFVFSSPGDATKLFFKKLYLFWAGVERSNNKYIQFFWKRFGLGIFPLAGFWLVGPLALFGGVLLWARRRKLALLYLFCLGYMVGVVVFFVNARFRLPVVPVLIVFAAYALCHLFFALRSRDTQFVKMLPVLAVCIFIVDFDFINFRGVRAFDEAVSHYELAEAFLKRNDKDSALNEFEKTRGIQERYPTRGYLQISGAVDYRLGTLYWERKDYTAAIKTLERIRSDRNAPPQARNMLADSYIKTNDLRRAIDVYESSLAVAPGDRQALLGLAGLHRQLGENSTAIEYLERLRAIYPDDPRVGAEIDALRRESSTP